MDHIYLRAYLFKRPICQNTVSDSENIPLASIETHFQNDFMLWDIETQDKIVYLIVAATAVYLAFPLLSTIKSLFGKSTSKELRFGCYEDACSSCTVIVEKSQPLRKTKGG